MRGGCGRPRACDCQKNNFQQIKCKAGKYILKNKVYII